MADPNYIPLTPPPGTMAEGANPFDQFVKKSPEPVEDNPFAQFVKPPTAAEDVKKAVVPGAIDALIQAGTLPASVMELTGKGIGYATGKDLGDLSNVQTPMGKFPTYKNVKEDVESMYGGPLYKAKTPAGRVVQKAEAIAPLAAMGPAGWGTKALMTAGGALGSEGFRMGAENAGYGPTGQAVAELTGGLIGGGVPAAVTGKVFPAIGATRQADAKVLGDLGVDLNAARATGRQSLMQRQANLGSIENEAPQFSAGVAKRAGIETGPDGVINKKAIEDAGKAINDKYDTLIKGNSIAGTGFTDLVNNTLPTIRRAAFRPVGNKGIGTVDEVINDIKSGAVGTGVLSIPGDRYLVLRNSIQSKMKTADPNTREALGDIKTALDDAMEAALPAGGAKDLHKMKANYDIVSNAKLDANERLSPKALRDAITENWGQGAYNRDRGLAPQAKAGLRVLEELPEAKPPSGALSKGLGTAAGMVAGYKMGGLPDTMTGGILGNMMENAVGPIIYRNPATKYAYNNPIVQSLLKSQSKPASAGDVASMLAALSGKPAAEFSSTAFNPKRIKEQSQSLPLVKK